LSSSYQNSSCSKDVDFYHLDNSYEVKRCLCHHVEIPEIVNASCHDPDQSFSGDVGVDVNIVDMLFFL